MSNVKKVLYFFSGRVFPERADVNIPPLKFKFDIKEAGITGTAITSIQASQVMVQFITKNKIENIYTLKNYVEDCIRLQVDVLGYLQACSYDVEITSMSDSNKNQPIVFGVNFDNIKEFRKKRPKEFQDIMKLFADKRGDYLRRCLSDLREAARNVKDVGLFCYRAIEALRQFFVYEKNCKGDKKSWERLRKDLKVDRSQIDYIKDFADITRHGNTKYISGEEYKKILNLTWDIVDKFIVYTCNNYTRINYRDS